MTALYSAPNGVALGAGGPVSDIEDTYEAAAERLDRALARLDASVRSLNGRVRAHARIEADTQRLIAERARFAADLDTMTVKARRLDDSAAEVGRSLIGAMETVRDVLVK